MHTLPAHIQIAVIGAGPVGVLTALIGVPVFLFLLARDSRGGRA